MPSCKVPETPRTLVEGADRRRPKNIAQGVAGGAAKQPPHILQNARVVI